MIGAVYEGRMFQTYDTEQTAYALSCFCIGLAGYAAIKVLTPAFYALKDSRTPMMVSIASVIVNYGLAVLMVRTFGLGHAGLALSTSGIALFSAVALFLLIRSKVEGLYGWTLWNSLWRVGVASLAMGGTVWAATLFIVSWPYLIQLLVAIPLGVITFLASARLLRIEELSLALDAFAGPLARRFPILSKLRTES